jgi:hypothetical protein
MDIEFSIEILAEHRIRGFFSGTSVPAPCPRIPAAHHTGIARAGLRGVVGPCRPHEWPANRTRLSLRWWRAFLIRPRPPTHRTSIIVVEPRLVFPIDTLCRIPFRGGLRPAIREMARHGQFQVVLRIGLVWRIHGRTSLGPSLPALVANLASARCRCAGFSAGSHPCRWGPRDGTRRSQRRRGARA